VTFVSVIIPNYNCARWIQATIDSCLAQKEYIKEIIVVDDFSTDESWHIMEFCQHSNPSLIKLFRNIMKGGNNARNYGFSLSSGDFIQWLDADDQLLPKKFQKQLIAFKENPSTDIVYSDWQLDIYSPEGDMINSEQKLQTPHDDFVFELLTDNWSAPHNYLLKRSLAEKLYAIKAWNPATKVWQDREYFTLAAITGARFHYVPGSYSVYNRWNKASVSAALPAIRYQNLEQILMRFDEMLTRQDWIQEPKRMTYRRLIFTQRLLIRGLGLENNTNFSLLKFSDIQWRFISGIRTTLRVFITYWRLVLS